MPHTIKFSVALASEHPGKWVARMYSARKVEGFAFGTFGIKTQFLGLHSTKEQALAAVAAKKATLKVAA